MERLITSQIGSPPTALRERTYLRWAGIVGLSQLVIIIALYVIAPSFPYPDDNLDGRKYLEYVLPHHTQEIQIIMSIALAGAQLMFVILLALAYVGRAGLTPAVLVMIGGMIAFVATELVVLGIYAVIGLIARGYPSFGSDQADLKLVTFAWDLLNTNTAVNTSLLGMVWAAIVFANRQHPILPRALGGWSAALVALACFASLGSLFISTGPWSPGSVSSYTSQGFMYVWIAVAGVVLLRARASVNSVSTAQSIS